MATDGPDPTPCDIEIFKEGKPVALLTGSSNAVENWVKEVARTANARVDWHYSGGVAQVLHLGDMDSRRRVEKAIIGMPKDENPRVRHRLPSGSEGLYRKGVTVAPKGAIASSMDPNTGEATYI
ncbi:hypothetical protein HQ571_00780 [Candidatus Kuenenbacteria bacterium]|nr:hypothetical protein [Candidatus Kuenenbacteria bacterium]